MLVFNVTGGRDGNDLLDILYQNVKFDVALFTPNISSLTSKAHGKSIFNQQSNWPALNGVETNLEFGIRGSPDKLCVKHADLIPTQFQRNSTHSCPNLNFFYLFLLCCFIHFSFAFAHRQRVHGGPAEQNCWTWFALASAGWWQCLENIRLHCGSVHVFGQ